jgi:protein-S-isoprenylcysteine O-methyltransferase Ste14
METVIFCICFGVCFICYAIRSWYHVLANRGSELAENKRFINVLFVIMFFLWFSWFGMAAIDPYKLNPPSWARYTGLALFIIGVCLFILSHVKMRGQKADQNEFVTTGIFSKIRHPMYFGFIIWIIGFPVFTNALFTLASAIIWIPQILYWKSSEERQLVKKYKEYQEYKKQTWF